MMNTERALTDVYMTTEHKKRDTKPKVRFEGVVKGLLISTLVLTSFISSTLPAFANTVDTQNVDRRNTTINYNYEVSVENSIFQVSETIKVLEQMKKDGVVTQEILQDLAKQVLELEKAVNIAGTETTTDIVDVIIKAERVIDGLEGAEQVEAAIAVAKVSLGIKIVKQETKLLNAQSGVVELSDIQGHWGQANIERLVGMQAINGYPDGTFKPNNTISFAEFLSISLRSVVKDIKPAPENTHWATGLYITAIEQGIFTSNEVKKYERNYNQVISREDMALILIRLNERVQKSEKVDTATTKSSIQDYNTISRDRQYFVEQAYKKGLLKGKGNGFDPLGNLTRAEAATAVINLLDYKPGQVVEAPKVEGAQILKWNDPNRTMAKEGDTFITQDGREVILKVDPTTGILGFGQNVATELGRVYTNGKIQEHGDLGRHGEPYTGQPYLVDKNTGMGLYREQWLDVERKIIPEDEVKNPKEGQIYMDYFRYRNGEWTWIGPVR